MRACPDCLAVFLADPEFCSFDGTKLRSGDDALKGSELAGHRIDALLGLGGTGCVFSGTRIEDGQRVAIKVLFGEMASDKSIAQRFEREAKAMSSISHRNVVAIHDFGTLKNGLVYLIMELLDGITLRERIEQSAPLTSDHAGRILEELTSGLAEAHRLGYVHRDLKPGNVILTGPFGKEQVKILDFGIVASLREGKDKERLTKTGYIIGTPTYMAPEQVDPSAITPQIDVYALGVILYEMLTGDAPFNGTLEQILVAKMTTEPKPIPDSGLLGELVLRMLAMEPEDRPPSALHVSAELSRLSLLTDDPATVRADAPQLGLWTPPEEDGGVRIIDRTDENDVVVVPVDEGERPSDPWVSDTRRVDVVDATLLEFSDVSTRESFGQRSDTVNEGVDHNDTFEGIPGGSQIPE
ncbi:MAG: serine/threonine-protein kinase, partial [Deltaproteobacteria bacterium]